MYDDRENCISVDCSEDLNYWKFGYEAVMITDGFFIVIRTITGSDTLDSLDAGVMALVIDELYSVIISLRA
ncbi:MAG: hypothetical protein WBB45_21875 [Cyclobacteriaceae bacterium]